MSVVELTVNSETFNQDTEYELDQSESLTFLYNLLYDEKSSLSKTDILSILNSLKLREENLPFSFNTNNDKDIQGVKWPKGLRTKFNQDRKRIGLDNWFHNIPQSFQLANKKLNIHSYNQSTDFYRFDKFFSKIKLHITHFQLRNLVCSSSQSNGIFYPSSYYHDYNLEMVNNVDSNETVNSFFKVNRLLYNNSQESKLDCLIDSRNLFQNSNSRISTLSCSANYLVSGTFEGNYILNKIDHDESELIGEYHLTNNYDGITNSILIKEEDNQLIISSNDKFIRYVDLMKNSKLETELPFAINCLALNKFNSNEFFASGDSTTNYIIDQRIPSGSMNHLPRFKGQEDFSFSCDWSPSNENWLLSGNQDGCVRIWDRRHGEEPIYTWSGSLGTESPSGLGGPVRNTKFSNNGDFICWAETLDHIGVLKVDDLQENTNQVERVQSIDFIGKCTGLSFIPNDNGYGEQLIIGVNDCPLGGILSYNLNSRQKCLDYDFYF